jgi:hypothetical protein
MTKTKQTLMSSTKEGNPPMAMKIRNEATNMSSDPLACKKSKSTMISLAFQ